MKCENPTCRSGRPARCVTPAFRPITAIADELADLNCRPNPELVRISTCRTDPCMAWARLRAEDIASPWIEDYAKLARRNNPVPPPDVQRERVARAISEAIAIIARYLTNRGEA